jgi:hypothetical protein
MKRRVAVTMQKISHFADYLIFDIGSRRRRGRSTPGDARQIARLTLLV